MHPLSPSDLGRKLTETIAIDRLLRRARAPHMHTHATVFVAEDVDKKTVVVAHQGTDPKKVLSIANDVEFKQVSANKTLFPQAAKGVQLHSGFQATQGRTADVVLKTVKSALKKSGYKKVLVTGHSLGAAVASLDAAMLRMALSKDVAVSAVVFGLPRVGNSDWATLLNKLVRVRPCWDASDRRYDADRFVRGAACAGPGLRARHEPGRPGPERAAALPRL